MTGQTVDELVISPVLRRLIAVRPADALADAWRVDQGEAEGVVVRFIRAIFAVAEHGDAVGAAAVSEIEPLM